MKRLLDRRTVVPVIAVAGILAVAIYASNANTGTAPPVQAHTAAVDQAASGLPVDVQGLIADAQQLSTVGGGAGMQSDQVNLPSPPDLIKQVIELLKKYGIDPSGIQPFLDKAAAATSPQQLTDDAKNFLIQQGVAEADFGQVQAVLEQMQQIPADPTQVPSIIQKLAGLAAKYWFVFPIIVAVAVAIMIFGSQSGKGKQDKRRKDGPGCGVDDQTLYGYWLKIKPPMKVTTGTGFVPGDNQFKITIQSGGLGNPNNRTNDENATNKDLAAETEAILTQATGKNGKDLPRDHVETKMATYMRLKTAGAITTDPTVNVDNLCLVINNVQGPCDLNKPAGFGCISAVPLLLSDKVKQTLTVNWPTSKDGTSWAHIDLNN